VTLLCRSVLKFNQPSEPIAHTNSKIATLSTSLPHPSKMADTLERPVGLAVESVLEQNQQEVDMLKLDLDYPLTR